jgi:hypothetical protein
MKVLLDIQQEIAGRDSPTVRGQNASVVRAASGTSARPTMLRDGAASRRRT